MAKEEKLFDLPFSELETNKTLAIIDDLKARVNTIAKVASEEVEELKKRYTEQARIELDNEIAKLNQSYSEKMNNLEMILKNKEFELDMASKEIKKLKVDAEIEREKIDMEIEKKFHDADIAIAKKELENEKAFNETILNYEREFLDKTKDIDAKVNELKQKVANYEGQLTQISEREKLSAGMQDIIALVKDITSSVSSAFGRITIVKDRSDDKDTEKSSK